MPDVTRIIEQKPTESIYNDDWVLIDRPTEGEDGGTRKILVSRLKELLCGDYIADEWVAGETYTNGAIVSHEGKLYYNKSGGALVHTTFNSNAWLEVKIDELLEKVIGSIGEKWRRVDTYHYDDLVVYGGRLYRCIKNASTQGTWVSNEWIEANAEYYFKKVREYIARYDFVPSGEAVSSPYNKGDLILYRAPGDTTNSLYMRLNDTEHGDPTWIPENWLKVGNIGGALSKIYDDMEESSCDVQIKEQSIIDENNVADLTSLAAVGSASGAIATFDDGSDLPMPKLEVAIEPQQDLHGYDSPWVGGSGKNKIPPLGNASNNGITMTTDINGNTIFNGTVASDGLFEAYIDLPSALTGDYVLSINNSQTIDGTYQNTFIALYNGSTRIHAMLMNAQNTKIVVTNGTITRFLIRFQPGVTVTNFKISVQLEEGSTATSYAPYSNICPISGWDEANVSVEGGQNLYNDSIVWKNGYYINSSGAETQSNNYKYMQTFIEVEPSTTYSIQADIVAPKDLAITVPYYSEQQSFISRNLVAIVDIGTRTYKVDFTTPSNCKYIRISVPTDTSNIVIHKKIIITIDLDGTRYGGKVDLVSGVLTVDRAYVDLGTLDYSLSSSISVFYSTITNMKAPSTSADRKNGIISSMFPVSNSTSISASMDDKSMLRDAGAIYIRDTDYNDTTAFKTAMSGVQLVYELATPITVQLSPTQVKSLLGVNNIWADTGAILDAEYIRDITTIINSLIARIEALENS